MRYYGRRLPALLCYLSVLWFVFVCACAPPPTGLSEVHFDQPVEVTFWHTFQRDDAKALDQMVNKFNKENQNHITVKAIYQGNQVQLLYKVLAAMNDGSSPDMAFIYPQHVSEYMRTQSLMNLEPYLKGKNGFEQAERDDMWVPLIDGGRYPQYGNALLTLPFAQDPVVLFMNEALVKESGKDIPQTWDQFVDVARAITRREAGHTTVSGLGILAEGPELESILLSRNVALLSADRKHASFNDQGGIDTFDMLNDLIHEGTAQLYKPGNTDWQSDFIQGKLGMMIAGASARSNFNAQGSKLVWNISGIPQRDPKNAVTIATGPRIGIFRTDSLHQAAAWEFIRWFYGTDQAATWASSTSFIPLRNSAGQGNQLKDAWKKQDPNGKQLFDLLKTVRAEPSVAGWSEVRSALEEAAVAILSGQSLSKEALDKAARRADAVLATAR